MAETTPSLRAACEPSGTSQAACGRTFIGAPNDTNASTFDATSYIEKRHAASNSEPRSDAIESVRSSLVRHRPLPPPPTRTPITQPRQ